MKSKDFEDICKFRMEAEERAGRATMSRYGVQASFMRGAPITQAEMLAWSAELQADPIDWLPIVERIIDRAKRSENTFRPLQSLPDFTGLVAPVVAPPRGLAFDFDAKVCSAASMDLHTSHVAERQLEHLRKRARFGAVAFFLIHFAERKLTKETHPAVTFAFPVSDEHPFWQAFDRGEEKRISRADCEEYAVEVTWNSLPGGRTPRPDVLGAVLALADQQPAEAKSW
jgi:penicillin-binding protein-related factor A (putative recombinase)